MDTRALQTLSLPRGINFKFLLQPHKIYEELGFSSLTEMKGDYTTDSHYITYMYFFNLGVKGLSEKINSTAIIMLWRKTMLFFWEIRQTWIPRPKYKLNRFFFSLALWRWEATCPCAHFSPHSAFSLPGCESQTKVAVVLHCITQLLDGTVSARSLLVWTITGQVQGMNAGIPEAR